MTRTQWAQIICLSFSLGMAYWLVTLPLPRHIRLAQWDNKPFLAFVNNIGRVLYKTWRRYLRPPDPIDQALIISEVAARLQAGADVQAAWEQTLHQHGLLPDRARNYPQRQSHPSVAPPPAHTWDKLTVRATGRTRPKDYIEPTFIDIDAILAQVKSDSGLALETLAVATRFCQGIGAPLAHTLDEMAEGIAEASRAESERQIALSGPRSSARLLGLLPLAGPALGTLVGADTLTFLFSTIPGFACLGAGIALIATGIVWSSRMARQALVDP